MQSLRIFLYLIFMSFFILIFQNTIFSLKFFVNIKPELFTLLIVNYAFYEKKVVRGYTLSTIIGLLEDILTNQIFGLNMFIKSLIFLIIYLLKEKIFSGSFFFRCFFVVIMNQIEFWFLYFLTTFFSISTFTPFKDNYFNYALFYIIITPIFVYIFNKIESKLILKYEG